MKLFTFLSTVFFTSSVFAVSDFSKVAVDPIYLSVDSFEIIELSDLNDEELKEYVHSEGSYGMKVEADYFFIPPTNNVIGLNSFLQPMASPIEGLNNFIRIGKLVYSIVESNQPVLQSKWDALSVLPTGLNTWENMSDWQAPKSKAYQLNWKNAYGMNVVSFTYRLNYSYGGKYNGKGQYLSNVQIAPIHVRVLWAYNLNSEVKVMNVQNTASLDSPVPAAEMQVTYDISTVLIKEQGSHLLYVKGDGSSYKVD